MKIAYQNTYHKVTKKGIPSSTEWLDLDQDPKTTDYWKNENKVWRMCDKEKEKLKHMVEECEHTRIQGANWKKILDGKKNNYQHINNILWKKIESER